MTRFTSIDDSVTSSVDRAAEATTETLDLLKTLGRDLNAVTAVYDDHALGQAASFTPGTALSGVPLAHKQLFRREGWGDDGGSPSFEGRIAGETATVISKLDAAGAIDCARLVTVEYALGVTGHNDWAGTPQNPWQRDYICGGSSSGSAAVVSAGIVPVALGSDTGGSIRLPAAACGLFGIKPSQGLVSRHGVFPLSTSLDTIGPLARSVRDAALVLEVIRGFDAADPESVRAGQPPLLASAEDGLGGLRIGRAEPYFLTGSDAPVADATDAAIREMAGLGGTIIDTSIPGIEDTNPINVLLIATEAARGYAETVLEKHPVMNDQTVMRVLAGAFTDETEYQRILSARAHLARRMIANLFEDIDLLVTPVWPFLLPSRDESDVGARPEAASLMQRIGHNTRPFNFLGLPVITVPVGLDPNRLPLSIQLVGKPFDEATLIRAATALERHYAFWDNRPAGL
jgi:aspartyl-tRNA(Asn)/glutamyl-tRNA(Gln) amidotransferase subunit A